MNVFCNTNDIEPGLLSNSSLLGLTGNNHANKTSDQCGSGLVLNYVANNSNNYYYPFIAVSFFSRPVAIILSLVICYCLGT